MEENNLNYIPVAISDPEFFSDEGERHDFRRINPNASQDVVQEFYEMRDHMKKHQDALKVVSMKAFVIAVTVGYIWFILTSLIGMGNLSLLLGVIVYAAAVKKMKKPVGFDTDKVEEKFADSCIEPIIAQIEPGVDASYKLIYYPIYGYVDSYKNFGRWLYDIGIIPHFNDRVEVLMSINTLNANREGFFLSNVEVWSEYHSKNHTSHVLKFKGPILTVRIKHGIDGSFACHTTGQGLFGKETDGSYKTMRNIIDVENQQFNELFNVEAESQKDAFYILSPVVIERMLYLRSILKSFGVYIKGDFCIFALFDNREYFTIPKKVENISIEQYCNDLGSLINLVYTFKDAIDISYENMIAGI